MTAQGAVEFVRAYYDERSLVIQNNARYDKYLPQYMAPTCECRALLDFYERELLGQNLRLEGKPYQTAASAEGPVQDARIQVRTRIESSEQKILDKAGRVTRQTPALSEVDLVTLEWKDNRWFIAASSLAS